MKDDFKLDWVILVVVVYATTSILSSENWNQLGNQAHENCDTKSKDKHLVQTKRFSNFNRDNHFSFQILRNSHKSSITLKKRTNKIDLMSC